MCLPCFSILSLLHVVSTNAKLHFLQEAFPNSSNSGSILQPLQYIRRLHPVLFLCSVYFPVFFIRHWIPWRQDLCFSSPVLASIQPRSLMCQMLNRFFFFKWVDETKKKGRTTSFWLSENSTLDCLSQKLKLLPLYMIHIIHVLAPIS